MAAGARPDVLAFEVDERAVAYKRPRCNRRTGAWYHSPDVEEWREAVRSRFKRATRVFVSGGLPLYGPGEPVRVWLTFCRPMPKSRPKSIVSEPDVYTPDVDNLAKEVLDALNGLAWADDRQVVHLDIRKADRVRGGTDRLIVEIAPDMPRHIPDHDDMRIDMKEEL